MPARLDWSAAADATILALRAGGASWDAIAARLGVSRWSASERGRLLGAVAPPPPVPDPERDPEREPLPPGHPLAWGAITAGTSLAGLAYPWPPLAPGRF